MAKKRSHMAFAWA